MEQSLGLMVNYVYDLSRVEENHENYMKNHKVVCSNRIRKLLAH
jgi:malonyl-CoA decarboxylase